MFRNVLEEQGVTGLALRAAGGCALEEMEAKAGSVHMYMCLHRCRVVVRHRDCYSEHK